MVRRRYFSAVSNHKVYSVILRDAAKVAAPQDEV
jgi:hypothetical protein